MQPLVYVDRSEVREGALVELKAAVKDLAEFVEANEPRLISYAAYFSEDGRHLSIVHIHADASSLDFHLDVAGPRFQAFSQLLTLRTIHIYGTPSDRAIGQMRDKLRLLGSGELVVYTPHEGFGRFAMSRVHHSAGVPACSSSISGVAGARHPDCRPQSDG
jgi:quinol monooxygenase YgiN